MLNKLYSDFGKKLKYYAKTGFVIVAFLFIIIGIVKWIDTGDYIIGLWFILLYPASAWVASWPLYGIGEIIDKLSEIEKNTRKNFDKDSNNTAKKQINKTEKKQKTTIQHTTKFDDDSITLTCPYCYHELTFDKEIESAECPYCNKHIEIKH